MNRIAGSILLTSLIACSACGAPTSDSDESRAKSNYSLHYDVYADGKTNRIDVSLTLQQSRGQLREMTFSSANIDATDVNGDGKVAVNDGRVSWHPPRTGGKLRWTSTVHNERNENGLDARLGKDWGIFRAEDIIPRAATRTLVGASSSTTLRFALPAAWSAVTQYSGISKTIVVDNPQRRFDEPSGWIAIGKLGVRRETIAGTRVVVAAPEGQSVRRMDMLALLNWTLPELGNLLSEPLPRLTVVSAAEPMWRGGLSAPASIFIHADRPLISENATSTLVHEVMHVALRIDAADGYDWITEGLAEFYSLELLQRGGAITPRRYKLAIKDQLKWAKQADALCGPHSRGATTAYAVSTFRELDQEIRTSTSGEFGLDGLVAKLLSRDTPVDLVLLQAATAQIIGEPSDALHTDKLPGCSTIAPAQ